MCIRDRSLFHQSSLDSVLAHNRKWTTFPVATEYLACLYQQNVDSKISQLENWNIGLFVIRIHIHKIIEYLKF